MDSVRVDVWLWSVRQCKSRSLATAECRAGHVRVNGEPVKASTRLRVGDEVRYRVAGFDRILKVTALISKRVGAPAAQSCYEDLTPERPKVYLPVMQRERGAGRPTKKERRELDRLFGRDSNFGHRG
ncbi:MAG: RNA-binding S4 domain-containing protein [Actinomycetaceae bacterium]|jgi:ribosome-associated heat shock protein Hsp15|nr:RNA-binding S4 domain-containing protein [Actinomycetaceae bacterium]